MDNATYSPVLVPALLAVLAVLCGTGPVLSWLSDWRERRLNRRRQQAVYQRWWNELTDKVVAEAGYRPVQRGPHVEAATDTEAAEKIAQGALDDCADRP